MNPTLRDGDIVLARKVWNPDSIKTGDIVITSRSAVPDKDLSIIKRVAFLPGETVTEDESYSNPMVGSIVGNDEIFLVGDNHSNSYDSRYFGPVKTSEIKYIAKTVIPLGLYTSAFAAYILLAVSVIAINALMFFIDKKERKVTTNVCTG